MKRVLSFFILITLCSCSGYSPIFSSKQTNFYIDKIIITEDDKLIRKIVKNLKPYTINNGKRKIELELNLKLNETVILRDEKGDVASQEIKITLDAKSILQEKKVDMFTFEEKFTFNNQSNKFELNQYKKNIQLNMIDKIYEDLILKLRTL
tara:strand:- start:2182 stop:2634 length:453 start_codon:yes stop_codon:yes gene_type:complete